MNEYQIKMKVYTGNLLPPYVIEGLEVYEAETAKEAIKMAQDEYRSKLGSPLAREHPLLITEVTKL